MGVYTDAYLAFGIDLGEELPEGWESTDNLGGYDEEAVFDPDVILERLAGCTGHEPYEERSAKREALPVALLSHCSSDYPMYILHVPGTVASAFRGGPTEIKFDFIDKEKVETFMTWCREHGIPDEDNNPTWLLASYWG